MLAPSVLMAILARAVQDSLLDGAQTLHGPTGSAVIAWRKDAHADGKRVCTVRRRG